MEQQESYRSPEDIASQEQCGAIRDSITTLAAKWGVWFFSDRTGLHVVYPRVGKDEADRPVAMAEHSQFATTTVFTYYVENDPEAMEERLRLRISAADTPQQESRRADLRRLNGHNLTPQEWTGTASEADAIIDILNALWEANSKPK